MSGSPVSDEGATRVERIVSPEELNRLRAEAARAKAPVEEDNEARTVAERIISPEQLAAMRAEVEQSRAAAATPRKTVSQPAPPPKPFETQPIPIRSVETPRMQSDPPPTLIIPMPANVSAPPPPAAAPEPVQHVQPPPPPPPVVETPAVVPPPPRSSTLPETPMPGPATQSRRKSTGRPAILWGVIALISLIAVTAAAVALMRPARQRETGIARTAPPPRQVVPPPVVPPPMVVTETVASPIDTTTDVSPLPTETETVAEVPPAAPPTETVAAAPVVRKKPAPSRRRRTETAPTATTAPVAEPVEPPPPQVQEGDLASLGEAGVIAPQLSNDVEPRLPMRTRMGGATGSVELSLLVDHRGNVAEVKVGQSSGNAQLDKAAIEAAQKTKFRPGTKDGVPVRIWITRNYNFRR